MTTRPFHSHHLANRDLLSLFLKFKSHFPNEESHVFTWKTRSHKLLQAIFSYSEGAAKEDQVRSEYQIKHNTNKGKRKRKAKKKRKTQCWPRALQLVLHTRPAWENTHQASKFRVNHDDPSGTVVWLSLLRDTDRVFRLQRSLWTTPGAMGK